MKNIIIYVIFIIILLAIPVGYSLFQQSVVLGDIKWQYHGGKSSSSTLLLRNKKIIGPYNISLWESIHTLSEIVFYKDQQPYTLLLI